MRSGLPLVCMAAMMWGTAGITGKWLSVHHQLDPLSIGAWRLLLGVPLMIIAAWIERKRNGKVKPLHPSHQKLLLLFGIGIAGYQICYFSAVDRTMVSTATLITICLAPVLVALCSRWFLREPWGRKTGMALVLGITGTALLIGVDSLRGLSNTHFLFGNALAFVAAFCYGGYTLVGKKLLSGVEPFRIIAWAFTLGALFMLPFITLPGFSLEVWSALLFLGWIPTALAYVVYILGLERTMATHASVAALLEPLTATVLAVTLFGEQLHSFGWVGVTVLLASMLLLSTSTNKKVEATNLEQ
ncbi:DMT family transporter [Salinithrix halophila]|uniref:DMT family transporter n=1 Tax=Salinithrix halophila TaxID=1485204 RepID=A0ABV8JK69_9BACL